MPAPQPLPRISSTCPPPDIGTYEEHCSFFVLGVKRRRWVSLKNDLERNRLVNRTRPWRVPAANERPDRWGRRDRLQPATCSGAMLGNRRSFICGQLVHPRLAAP